MDINLANALTIAFGVSLGLIVYEWSKDMTKIIESWLERKFKK